MKWKWSCWYWENRGRKRLSPEWSKHGCTKNEKIEREKDCHQSEVRFVHATLACSQQLHAMGSLLGCTNIAQSNTHKPIACVNPGAEKNECQFPHQSFVLVCQKQWAPDVGCLLWCVCVCYRPPYYGFLGEKACRISNFRRQFLAADDRCETLDKKRQLATPLKLCAAEYCSDIKLYVICKI